MYIGLLRVEFQLLSCDSLKGKRQCLQSIKDKFGKLKNVAVCESQFNDLLQRAELAFVCIANEKSVIEPTMARISSHCATISDAQIINEHFEWL